MIGLFKACSCFVFGEVEANRERGSSLACVFGVGLYVATTERVIGNLLGGDLNSNLGAVLTGEVRSTTSVEIIGSFLI